MLDSPKTQVPMSVLCDGATTEPRLSHPEGVAVDGEGNIWCGGDRGEIFRIAPDGSSREVVANTDGFCLGMAFDRHGDLFVCDMKHAAVFRLEVPTGKLELFSEGVEGHRFRVPNYPAFDRRGRLFVSDSWDFDASGPGIVAINPDGSGELWHAGPFRFANGLAFNADGSQLYVVETFRSVVAAIDVRPDGSAGEKRDLAVLPGSYPDGLAVGEDGSVFVGCYEPSRVLRVSPGGDVTMVGEDVTAHMLAHPTNIAFQGDSLIACNLGRWHLTKIDVGLRGVTLPPL
ncbi:gluconolaconase [Nocardioides immobilis]|uniref:Gluconolaconase n=1 Tax=Nocardioides immobilis TaxID=2049295 RepID=A0A417Y6U8_9ACTN|nr:SMP-30/gluconolactonase/LRE family protein [Nocardioides immobilis]RHW28438.1 gluconolaconase [Nocardioides immobilis]